MENLNKAKFSDLANNAGNVLSAFGKILGVFKPALGTPVAMAGAVLTDLIKVDDSTSKDKLIGITSTIIVDEIIQKIENGEQIDVVQLKVLNENLKLLDLAIDKFYKIVS
ncbi:hypothetical protein [Campylobacter fetus]|uniref:hypothetical protein n=1 Tax=Campylobacter fetus TaxID=196 RepID=UPI003AF88FB1